MLGSRPHRRVRAALSFPTAKEPVVATIYYEKDADRSLIAGRKVAILDRKSTRLNSSHT